MRVNKLTLLAVVCAVPVLDTNALTVNVLDCGAAATA